MNRIEMVGAALFMTGIAFPRPVDAVAGTFAQESIANVVEESSLLARPARLDVEDVSLVHALTALRQHSNVDIAFSPILLPAERRASCACNNATVREALDRILEGTGFGYFEMPLQVVIQPPLSLQPLEAPTLAVWRDQPVGWLRRNATPVLQGTLMGEVTEAQTGRPLAGVQISIDGMTMATITDVRGRYNLSNVPSGTHTLTVQSIGYATLSRQVTVTAEETTVADFELERRVIDLDEVIVTGTAGGMQRRAVGNVVGSIDAEDVMERAPITDMDQLLGQRTAGVIMLPGTGQIGTGSSIRIRGISSITQGAEPIIYIDGIRMDSNVGGGRSGGPSRLNDIHPANIATIEIIKGPAAATLYGTEASNGVIQIITKRGEEGAPRFDVTSRIGTNWMWNPEGRASLRYMPDPDNTGELVGVNIFEQERLSGHGPIFDYGLMQSHNLSIRGGTEALRYFAAVSRTDDNGIVAHNWERRTTLRANLDAVLAERLSLAVGTSLNRGQIRLSEGVAATAAFRNVVWAVPANTAARGFRTSPPEEWSKVESRADNDRATASVELRYQLGEWSNHRLVAGIDLNSEVAWDLVPRINEESMQFFGALGQGSKDVTRGSRTLFTVDYSGRATIGWRDFSLTPSVGFQYYKTQSNFITASGEQFPAIPITTVSGAAARSGGETFSENATLGVYLQQQVGWRDRAFFTAAIRADDNSAFGAEFDAAIYPKASATWVISEEPFWSLDFMEQVRLRAAWGVAGQQPGTFDASRLYSPAIGFRDEPALSPSSFGNPSLKPERSEELEFGFDARLLGGRLELEATHYRRNVKDAIVERTLPPSSGFPGSQIVNIGHVRNWGFELGAAARLIERGQFAWDLDVQVATTSNEIESLGDIGVIPDGTQSQHREGYSIADIFMLRILEAEIDEDARVLSAMCDGGRGPQGVAPGGDPVPCSEAPQVWLGHSQPTWQIGVGNTFTLREGLQLFLRVEGNGGHIHNATEIRATHNLGTTEAVLRRDNPLLHAYRALENDRTGVYDAGFLRLREASLRYQIPRNLVGRIGAETGSVTLGMRNVAMLWTAQHGWSTPRDGHVVEPLGDMIVWDPETRGTGSTSVGFQQNVPQTASATLSFRLSF